MGLVRMHNQNAIHFVTNRCFQERLFMLPSKTLNQIIGYWFARAYDRYGQGLEIFAFIFLSNHFHLLVRDKAGNLARFMGYFQGNVSLTWGNVGMSWSYFANDVTTKDMGNLQEQVVACKHTFKKEWNWQAEASRTSYFAEPGCIVRTGPNATKPWNHWYEEYGIQHAKQLTFKWDHRHFAAWWN